ncbi:MAG: hypothetical protein Pars2KO_00930 [Parasphingorhabdus sp.]
MGAFVAFGIIVLAAMAAQNPDMGKLAEPLSNPGTWATPADYPKEALEERAEGRSSFRLTISVGGKVKSCTITDSSGFAALDEQTCRLLMANGSFRPALDENGKPIEGEWRSAVRWTLPEQFTFPFRAERTIRIILIQEKDGVISSCKVEGLTDISEEKSFCERAKIELRWPEGQTYEPDRKKIVLTTTRIREISVLED